MEITYSQLLALKNNAELQTEEIYNINDYPNIDYITVTASDESTLNEEVVVTINSDSNYDGLYTIDNNDSRIGYTGTKGILYYLNDQANNISAYYDFSQEDWGVSSNVHVGAAYNTNGQIILPTLTIKDCTHVTIEDYCDNIDLSGVSDLIMGVYNDDITIHTSDHITIGDYNEEVEINGCTSVNMADGNNQITCTSCNYIHIGSDNQDITVTEDYNIIGSDNKTASVSGTGNEIKTFNNKINVTGERNKIDNLLIGNIGGKFNAIKDGVCVDLINSFGNKIEQAKLVNMDTTNNNEVYVANLSLDTRECFSKYHHIKGQQLKAKDTLRPVSDKEADNNGSVMVRAFGELEESIKSGMEYYRTVDNVWSIEPAGKGGFKTFSVRVEASNDMKEKFEFTGTGMYDQGDNVTITAVAKAGKHGDPSDIVAWLDLSDGNLMNSTGSVTFQIQHNTVLQPRYE